MGEQHGKPKTIAHLQKRNPSTYPLNIPGMLYTLTGLDVVSDSSS